MAGRTSMGVGVGITITLLGVLVLVLFVTTTIFFGKANNARRELKALQATTSEIVTDGEKNTEGVRVMLEQAKQSRKTLVGFMAEAYGELAERSTGSRSDSPEQVKQKLADIKGAENTSLAQLVRSLQSEVATVTSARDKADAARTAALADFQAESERTRSMQAQHQGTIDELNKEIDRMRDEATTYREGTNLAKGNMDARVERIDQDFRDREGRLKKEIDDLRSENLVLSDQFARLRGEKTKELLRGKDEFALVDGRVVGINGAENQAYISIGADRKVVLGMTFSVYADAGALRPNATTGEYPRGKAALEVISVGPNTSTCRILYESKGSPVVTGDVIANAIYDPNKVYKFVVFGNFDVNRDGSATPLEAADLRTLIQGWGGDVVDDVSGDVDFLVLGEEPVLPPRPSSDAPLVLQEDFINREKQVTRYRRLFEQAQQTGIPLLNENRLYTLIGRAPGGR
jgi:hypothetical protein